MRPITPPSESKVGLNVELMGTMQFNGSGDPIKSAVVIQIRNGTFTYRGTTNP